MVCFLFVVIAVTDFSSNLPLESVYYAFISSDYGTKQNSYFLNEMRYCWRIQCVMELCRVDWNSNEIWYSVWYDKQCFNGEKRIVCKNFTRRDPRDCIELNYYCK